MKKNKTQVTIFYRIKSGKKLFSFGGPIGQAKIANTTLIFNQEELIKKAGGRIIDIEEKDFDPSKLKHACFAFTEDLFFTPRFIIEAIKIAKIESQSIQFCLAENDFNNRFVLPANKMDINGREFQFYFYHQQNRILKKRILFQHCYENHVEVSANLISSRIYPMNQCDLFASHIITPFHLLQVNIALNLNRMIKLQKWIPKKLRGGMGSSRSYRFLKRYNRIGKNVRIHPTARIEGSIIGDNCSIGANAVIRLSTIGANCLISDGVIVKYSVLGNNNSLSSSTHFMCSMTHNNIFFAWSVFQFSIIGHNSSIHGSSATDFHFSGNTVRIQTENGLLDSYQPFLGAAIGNRCKIAPFVLIPPGRVVPNGSIILTSKPLVYEGQ